MQICLFLFRKAFADFKIMGETTIDHAYLLHPQMATIFEISQGFQVNKYRKTISAANFPIINCFGKVSCFVIKV